MIYEINKKPHIKVGNYYAEIVIDNKGIMKPVKEHRRIYNTDVSESQIKEYSKEEYLKKKTSPKNDDKIFE